MALQIKQLSLVVAEGDEESRIRQQLEDTYGIHTSQIRGLVIKKKSLDARKKSKLTHHFQIQLELEEKLEKKLLECFPDKFSQLSEKASYHPLDGISKGACLDRLRHRPVIVGSGPAGSFAALVLAEAGLKPIVIERGEPVEKRLRSVRKLLSASQFDEESNYCYGEGGAGTFSDGKLTCGRNHPLIRYLFEEWVRFGAPSEILYEAHPHIGTDNLLKIAKNMRVYLEELGVDFLFGRRLDGFGYDESSAYRYKLDFSDGSSLKTDHFILAIGHSARDTYEHLVDAGLAMGPKPFAIGARFEHPQDLINHIQYGACSLLPAAEYKLAAHVQERGIWTFCMCPGGHLLPTGAQAGHLAINGMSYHSRNSGFANAAVVVNVNREDYYRGHVLDGVRFQKAIEKKAFQLGGGNYFSPAQRLVDFLKSRDSKGSLHSSYKPGVSNARIDKILPQFVVSSLQEAIVKYNQKMHGFISDEAIVAGVETKTSSPVVMMRDKSLQSTSHRGLYPCGEGAGYAGGIVSAALDGVKVARALLENIPDDFVVARPNAQASSVMQDSLQA